MKQDLFHRVTASFCIVLLFFTSAEMSLLWANPTGGTPISGSVSISSAGNTVTVSQISTNAIIHWNDFSINAGETTQFNLQNASGATLNRVTGAITSTIAGNLTSNGRLFLINPNGVIVSNTGIINTAGFLASTRGMTDADFFDGGSYSLDGTGTAGIDVSSGASISASSGDVILVGQRITNSGNLSAPNGVVGLAAGKQIVYTPGGNEVLRVVSGIPDGGVGVNQTGVINAAQAELKAAGGNVYALAVSARGTVAAQGTTTRNGRILLTANNGNVEVGGNLSARDSDSSGGQITTVGSGNTRPGQTIVAPEANLSTGGGSRSSIAISSLSHTRVYGTLNTPGGTVNINAGGALDYQGSTTAANINTSARADTTIADLELPDDEVLFSDPITSQINIDTLRFSGASNIFASSFGDLTVQDPLATFDPINFNLSADRDLTFNNQVSSAGNLDLRAGRTITVNDGLNTDGTGSDIFLRSGSTTTIGAQGLITTADGNIIISTSGGFINNRALGSNMALQAGQFGDGRWIIYAPTPASVKLGGLTPPTVEAFRTAPIKNPGELPVTLADGPNALLFASSDPRFVSADVSSGFIGEGGGPLNPIIEAPIDTSLISRPPSSSTSPTAHPGTLNPAGETVAQRDARLKAEAIILQLVGLPTPGNAGVDFFPILFNALADLLGPEATQADFALFLASLATNEEARFLLAGQLTATTMALIKSPTRTPLEAAFLSHIASKMGDLQLAMAERTLAEYEQYKVDRFESHLNSFSVLLDPIGKGFEAGTIVSILSNGNQAELSAGERWGVSASAGFVGGLPFAVSGGMSVAAAAKAVALAKAALAAQAVVTGATTGGASGAASGAAAGGAIASKVTAGAVSGPVVIIVIAIMAIAMQSMEVSKIQKLEKAMKDALENAQDGFNFSDYLGSETEEAFLQEMLNYQFGISPTQFAEGLSGSSDITTLPNGNLLINGLEVMINRP